MKLNDAESPGSLFLVFFVLGAFIFVGPLHAQELATSSITGDTVAVPKWQAFGKVAQAQDWLGESLQRLSSEDLARIGELNVIDTDVYQQTMSEAGLTDVNPNNSRNARKMISALGADILLVGTYQIEQNQIQLSAVFYDPRRDRTIAAHEESGSMGKIKVIQTNLIKELLRKAGVSLGSAEIGWLERKKKLRTRSLEFERPQPRPDVMRRDDEVESIYEAADLKDPSGEVERNDLVVGLHWPGFSVGYQPERNITLEFRAEANSDITVLGGRWNYHYYRFGKSNLYWGLQASHIDFVGEVSEGTGFLGGGFMGFEQYVSERFSVKSDVGAYMTSLEDDETSVSVSGLGFSLVSGVALHFW